MSIHWAISASYENGGKSSVTLHEGAGIGEVLGEIHDYLKRGANEIRVFTFEPKP